MSVGSSDHPDFMVRLLRLFSLRGDREGRHRTPAPSPRHQRSGTTRSGGGAVRPRAKRAPRSGGGAVPPARGGGGAVRPRAKRAREAAGGAVRRRRSCGGPRPPTNQSHAVNSVIPSLPNSRSRSEPAKRRGEQFAEGEAAGAKAPYLDNPDAARRPGFQANTEVARG